MAKKKSTHRFELEQYFLNEQGFDEEVVYSSTTSELEQLYEEFNQY